jgi:modulator of FtsH protease
MESAIEAAYNPTTWTSFFSAQTGACAALTGLIFVAVSINLSRIVPFTHLVSRAAKALITLIGNLIACTLCMIPSLPVKVLGAELAVLGFLGWILVTICQRRAANHNQPVARFKKIFDVVLGQCSLIPLMLGGISLIASFGGGLNWLPAGVVFSFVAALLDAWVLLIEINR